MQIRSIKWGVVRVGLGCLVASVFASCSGTSIYDDLRFPGGGTLTASEIARGLREALRVGTDRVVADLGQVDGFNANPEIHIPLPAKLRDVQSALRTIGASGLADDLELRLNRAAESAMPQAKAIFWDAIAHMTLDDVTAIYEGQEDEATRYFQEKMTPALRAAMEPVVAQSLSDAGAVQAYDRLLGKYRTLPLVPNIEADLTRYALDGTLDALFIYLAREEAAIRRDPAKRTTALLRRVFGTT